MKWENVAPLPSTFLLAAIVGFLISAIYIMPRSTNWGFTFLIFFAVMFISSFISVAHGPVPKR